MRRPVTGVLFLLLSAGCASAGEDCGASPTSDAKILCLMRKVEALESKVEQLDRQQRMMASEAANNVRYGEIFFVQNGVDCLVVDDRRSVDVGSCATFGRPTRWTVQRWHE